MKFYEDRLQNSTYQQLRDQFPSLRQSVYEALRDMQPNQVAWRLENDLFDMAFNSKYVDNDTQEIIILLLAEQMENENLRLTREELTLGFFRVKELIMIADCCEQEIFQPVIDDKGVHYLMPDSKPTQYVSIPTVFTVKPVKYRGTITMYSK